MPQNAEKVTIKPREVFHSMEQWKNWLLTILLILVLAVACKDVDASDAETMYNEDQALTLTVESAATVMASIEAYGGDVNQVETGDEVGVEVNIQDNAVVRSIEAGSVGAEIPNFPRSARVIGHFEGDETPFEGYDEGMWLVVECQDGRIGAVRVRQATQTDGTSVLVDEAGNVYAFSGGEFSPVPADEDEVGGGDGDGDEPDPTATATPEQPDQLVVPEVPSSFEVTINVFENGTIVPREVTVTPNVSMPLPLGLVDFDRYPQFRSFAELIEANMSGGNRTTVEPLRSVAIHAIYIGRTGTEATGYAHHFAIQRDDGTWVSFISSGGQGNIAVLSVNRELVPTASNAQTNLVLVSAPTRLGNNRLDVTANPVMAFEDVILLAYDSSDSETGVEDQGPYAQGQRASCGGRNTREIIDYITEDSDNICTLQSGIEIEGAVFTMTGIAALDN